MMSLLPILLHFRKPLILQKLKEKNSIVTVDLPHKHWSSFLFLSLEMLPLLKITCFKYISKLPNISENYKKNPER